MSQNQPNDIVIRFGAPFKLSVLLLTVAALGAYLPLAIQAIPHEALGAMIVFLLLPAVSVYAAFCVFSFIIRLTADRIVVEVIPNPVLRAFQCRYAEMSGIEKESGWSVLAIYRFNEAMPFRISGLELLEGSPAGLLEQIKSRLPGEIFLQRITERLRLGWPWHRRLANFMILAASAWFSFQILDAGGVIDPTPSLNASLVTLLVIAAAVVGAAEWVIIREMNRD
jgi:hypothetical protein